MSLATRLTALAQAVGADIKDLRSKSLTWRGAWDNSTNYVVNDTVTYLGSTYKAKVPNASVVPEFTTSVWDVVAQKGAPGYMGEQGPQGIQGIPGVTPVINASSYRSGVGGFSGTTMTGVGGIKPIDPRSTGVQISPAGSFVENSDLSVSIPEAGWYNISAQIVTTTTVDAVLSVYLGTTSGGSQLGNGQGRGATGSATMAAVTLATYLAAGTKIFLGAYTQSTVGFGVVCNLLSITRIGGPTGPKGDTGPMGGTMGAGAFRFELPSTSGSGISYTALPGGSSANWTQIPLPAAPAPIVDPVGAMVRNADGSVSPVEAGWYAIEVEALFSINQQTRCYLALSDTAGGSIAGANAWSEFGTQGSIYPNYKASAIVKLTAGQKVFVNATSDVANSVGIRNFVMCRLGGPQGPMGPAWQPAEPNALTKSIASAYAGGWNGACTFSGGGFSGDAAAYTVAADRVTVRDAGVYTISAMINGPASTNRHLLQLLVNGGQIWAHDTGNQGNTGSGIGPSVGFTLTMSLAAGAYIQLVTFGNVAGSGVGLFTITRQVQGQPGPKGDTGAAGSGVLPPGGQIGQTLVKTSPTDGAAAWQTPIYAPLPFTASGVTVDRSFNASATSLNEIANVLGTLINDMKAAGLIASVPP